MAGIYDDLFDEHNNPKTGLDFNAILIKWKDKTYYEILGISISPTRSASPAQCEEIKKKCRHNYKNICFSFHPDRVPAAIEVTKLVLIAYATLIDAKKKFEYDNAPENQAKLYEQNFPAYRSTGAALFTPHNRSSPAPPKPPVPAAANKASPSKQYVNFQEMVVWLKHILVQFTNQQISNNTQLSDEFSRFIDTQISDKKIRVETVDSKTLNEILLAAKKHINTFLTTNPDLASKLNMYFDFLALQYGFTSNIKQLPTILRGAELLLKVKLGKQEAKTGDFVVCYSEHSGIPLLVFVGKDNRIDRLGIASRYFNAIFNLPLERALSVSIEELFALRSSSDETILQITTSQPMNGANKPLEELLTCPDLVRPIVNNIDTDDGTTVMHHVAGHYLNEALCRRLVDLGARVDIIGARGMAVANHSTFYIPSLLQYANEKRAEKPSILESYKLEYKRRANPHSDIGRLNLAILDYTSIDSTQLQFANHSTMACVMVMQRIDLVEKLLANKQIITAEAFSIALLSNNDELIRLTMRNIDVNRYPQNISEILSLCSTETQQLFEQIKQDNEFSADVFKTVLEQHLPKPSAAQAAASDSETVRTSMQRNGM